jgi:hypothetical protein
VIGNHASWSDSTQVIPSEAVRTSMPNEARRYVRASDHERPRLNDTSELTR